MAAHRGLVADAFMLGDEGTNLLQLFYVIPALSMLDMKLKGIYGYMMFMCWLSGLSSPAYACMLFQAFWDKSAMDGLDFLPRNGLSSPALNYSKTTTKAASIFPMVSVSIPLLEMVLHWC